MRLEKVFDPFFGHRVNVYPQAVLLAFFREKVFHPPQGGAE